MIDISESMAVIEAVIFASGDPVESGRIAEILEITTETVDIYIGLLNERYENSKSGLKIININNSYQMTTRPEYSTYIKRIADIKKTAPLSNASMEVLTVIAYNQPVSKGFIENVRGTDSSSIVNSLVEKGLIEEAGRLDVPGRPVIYRTTDIFLRSFGLKSLDELPPLPDRTQLNNE